MIRKVGTKLNLKECSDSAAQKRQLFHKEVSRRIRSFLCDAPQVRHVCAFHIETVRRSRCHLRGGEKQESARSLSGAFVIRLLKDLN